MRVFISAGEPSGDLHGANLIRTLKTLHPNIECQGFGGDKMAAAGCRLIYPLCHLAVMWFARVLAQAPLFLQLISKADRYFRHQRPDAVVLIDYPGFNWWMARRAHYHGIPVFYFVPPQLWAWAGWRVRKMKRYVNHVLCSLPFEEPWYRARNVEATYVGHPFFDELPRQQLDEEFIAAQRLRPETIVGLLPGSRNQEVEANLSTLVRAAARIHSRNPDTRFLMACFKSGQRRMADHYLQGRGLPIETFTGRTPEIIQLAHACVAVSGSVALELLYRIKPTVVTYRASRLTMKLGHWLKTCRYISLVNLLADKELFPELVSQNCEAAAIADHILNWLNNPIAYQELCSELANLRKRVALPGACQRAAAFILQNVNARSSARCA